MKRHLIIISGLIILAFVVLLTLNATIDKPNSHKNGFNRVFGKKKFIEVKKINVPIALSSICSVGNDSIFFSCRTAGKIYLTNYSLDKWDTFDLHIPVQTKLKTNFYTFINYPEIYIFAGNLRCYIKGNFETKRYEVTRLNIGGTFTKVVQCTPDNYVMEVIDTSTLNARFKTVNIRNQQVFTENNILLPLGDAGFTNDGHLNFDHTSQILLYVPYYNNNIIAFDTSMRLLFRGHTLDTNTTSSIQFVKNAGTVTHSSPPVTINAHSWIFDKKLYVQSLLKGDDEDQQSFDKRITLDCFDIADGHYVGSSQLIHTDGKKLLSVSALNQNGLLALYEHSMVHYKCQ